MTERRLRQTAARRTMQRGGSAFVRGVVACGVLTLATCARDAEPPRTPSAASAAPGSVDESSAQTEPGSSFGSSGEQLPAEGEVANRKGAEPGGSQREWGDDPETRALQEAAGPLAPFWRALAAARQGRRAEPVRMLWLGDSHTAADFMTGALRQELQRRHGRGGAGFVRAGITQYRHHVAQVEVGGKWRRIPQQPSRRSTVLDGVFGLCGMRAVPEPGSFASVRLRDKGQVGDTPVRWTIAYRAPEGGALQVRLGERSERLAAAPDESIQRFVVEGAPGDELRIEHAGGAPEVFGVFADSAGPGVVVDTCGIDGARIATLLAWEAEAWQREVRLRAPDLVVLAFGTNEAFDGGPVERYGDEFRRVMERVRAAVRGVPCWIVGPPDARDASGRAAERVASITEVQRRAAESLGCGFVSLRELMGGEGSFGAWRSASPPLAAADGIHLTGEGYRKLGAALAEALLPAGVAAP